jgi:hypothetical protein
LFIGTYSVTTTLVSAFTQVKEKGTSLLSIFPGLYISPLLVVGMHLMLTTLPPHPAYRHFTGERGVTIEKMERVNGYVFITGGLMGGAGYEPL